MPMDTNRLKTFATRTRKDLIGQVARRLEAVLPADSDARREAPAAMAELDREIAKAGKAAVVDRVAYTWFNRFTALRYMDVRGYLVPRVVSPAEGETRPEILSQAAQGILPDHVRKDVATRVRDLLEGRSPSREPQVEAYRLLVVASCNALHGLMPFLFERIADYTELLMPNELLGETGWVAELRAVMTPDACQDVEIIGWLYQFYVNEKKQEVFDALKKNVKITAENIPAATQLFTPHWIVRYLVENSLGRLWLLNNPDSGLAARMDYYIAPEEPETDFLRIEHPEEIRVCDPACGSGHMLTYAFDLLHEIYLERGYAARDIPGLILTHNLTGVEIDERAGGLAAFALMMKAAERLGRRRFLQMEARPDVVVLEDVTLRLSEFNALLTELGHDLNVDRLAGSLRTVPLALAGLWAPVSAYLKRAEGAGFEDACDVAEQTFASDLAEEIALFDEAAQNPFLVNRFRDLRQALVAIADKDAKARERGKLEREFGKKAAAPRLAARIARIGADYRIHRNDKTYRMDLDALAERIEEATRHPEALPRLREIADRLTDAVGFHAPLWATVRQFGQAKNFGSLIVPKVADAAGVLEQVRAAHLGGDMMLPGARDRVVTVLRMAEALSPKYHVVVANPPYMGGKGMNAKLGEFAKERYPDTKSDLFAMFMERSLRLAIKNGMMAMINMQAWMFLSSFEKLRGKLLSKSTLLSMVHLGERAFDTIAGAVVSTTAFVFAKSHMPRHKGEYVRLVDGSSESEKATAILQAVRKRDCGWLYRASSDDFEQIPGNPIAYWMSREVKVAFSKGEPLKKRGDTRQGMATSDNGRFLRSWWEVEQPKICLDAKSREEAKESGGKWFPYNKGGGYRKWFGNVEHVVNWEKDGAEVVGYAASLYGSPTRTIKSMSEYFKPSVSWSKISSGNLALRYYPSGFIFDVAGCCIFTLEDEYRLKLTGFMNSHTARRLLTAISPTLNFEVGHIASLPILYELVSIPTAPIQALIDMAKTDWDSDETSWDFTTLPLLSPDHRADTLQATYARLRAHWQGMADEMQRLEEENNRIFIDAYGLQDELTTEVPIEEITLTCNPAYRYGVKCTEEDREARLRADTMKEFISYAVGCMFGRYSLDAPGLILANQGDTLREYLAQVPEPSFLPDADNIIPVLGDDRFEEDAYTRFRAFLAQTFGRDQLEVNLAFIREALGQEVRDYLVRKFFDDHVTRYKRRPIYWMISSPKGAFQALIYMHRYNPDTLNTVLTGYVRPLRERLEAAVREEEAKEIAAGASAAEKNKARREIDRLTRQIRELTEWERDHLYPMALQRIAIDLDDGVKRNYPRFDGVLKPVKGISDE